MKKNIIILLCIITCISCKTTKTVQGDVDFGTSIVATTLIATAHQVDSVCIHDTLPDYITWKMSKFTDFETGSTICKRVFVKNKKYTYVLSGCEEPYKLIKRETR